RPANSSTPRAGRPENTVSRHVSRHRIHIPEIPGAGEVEVAGPEAHHALRVKRLRPGDEIELLDGRGGVGEGVMTDFTRRGREFVLVCSVREVHRRERPRPALHVLAAAPKGPRLGEMIAGLSQVGAASWSALISARTVVEPGDKRLDRLRAVAVESLKQCGRPWLMDLRPPVAFADALARGPLIAAHADAPPYTHTPGDDLTLMVGPEGGWTREELAALGEAGASVASFGMHTMRTETAAVVCAGVVLHLARVSERNTLGP
ncbi:MAG TPA: RsmE family RNA methyltransferase, partial [Dehalococcoidia bacterium]|nr:RsmE family RNA methyltransferase [Dehalococcoidia bacterium]